MYEFDFLRLSVRRVHQGPALIQCHTVIQATNRRPAIGRATLADFTDLLADMDVNRCARTEYFIGECNELRQSLGRHRAERMWGYAAGLLTHLFEQATEFIQRLMDEATLFRSGRTIEAAALIEHREQCHADACLARRFPHGERHVHGSGTIARMVQVVELANRRKAAA